MGWVSYLSVLSLCCVLLVEVEHHMGISTILRHNRYVGPTIRTLISVQSKTKKCKDQKPFSWFLGSGICFIIPHSSCKLLRMLIVIHRVRHSHCCASFAERPAYTMLR